MKLTDESKQKLFDTYNQLIKSYGQEHVLQKIKRKMYNYMQRNKLDRATAFIMAVKVTAHETKADPSPITPASTRTTDGGKGNGNFEHKECFGQVEGSSKAGGTLKTESVTVDLRTIDEATTFSKMDEYDMMSEEEIKRRMDALDIQNLDEIVENLRKEFEE